MGKAINKKRKAKRTFRSTFFRMLENFIVEKKNQFRNKMKTRKIRFNKISFVLLFVIFSNAIFSQINVYKPFPQIGTWIVQSYGPCGPDNGGFSNAHYTFSRYQVNGDTTSFGSYIYYNVTCASSTSYSYPANVTYGPSTFCFAYRNDIPNKKVYLYINLSGQYKDTLWYDFNLNIGDTLNKTFSINSFGDSRTIVTSIDSVLICGEYHKKFQFNCQGYPSLDLIEGVGFVDNFIGTSPMCPFEPVYLYNTEFTCLLLSVKEETSASIHLFPNPLSEETTLKSDKFMKNATLTLYNMLGQETKKIKNISGQTITFHRDNLSRGTYFIRLTQDNQTITTEKIIISD